VPEIGGCYCRLFLVSLNMVVFPRYKQGIRNLLFNVLKNKLVIMAYKVSKHGSVCNN